MKELLSKFFLLRLCLGAVIAFYLAHHGLKKKSLAPSGAIAAVAVGFLSFASSYRAGIILILFYFVSSKLTKWTAEVKAKLEDGYDEGGTRSVLVKRVTCLLAGI